MVTQKSTRKVNELLLKQTMRPNAADRIINDAYNNSNFMGPTSYQAAPAPVNNGSAITSPAPAPSGGTSVLGLGGNTTSLSGSSVPAPSGSGTTSGDGGTVMNTGGSGGVIAAPVNDPNVGLTKNYYAPTKLACPVGATYDAANNTCVCAPGYYYDAATNTCIMHDLAGPQTNNCQPGYTLDANNNCVPITCPAGTTFNPATGNCDPALPSPAPPPGGGGFFGVGAGVGDIFGGGSGGGSSPSGTNSVAKGATGSGSGFLDGDLFGIHNGKKLLAAAVVVGGIIFFVMKGKKHVPVK